MKRNTSKKTNCIRPSPNEEAAIVQTEQERRKRIRLKQVREQEKAFALKVRQNIKNKRENELKILSNELQKQWTEKQQDDLKTLENKYQKNLEKLGDGHAAAVLDQNTNKKDNRVISKDDKKRAIERHNQAMHQLLHEKEQCEKAEKNQIETRAKVLEAEKARSSLIASLPPPKDIIFNFDLTKEQKVQPKNIEDFKSTHYHLQKHVVQVEKMEKENQVDARCAAEEEEDKIHGIIESAQRSQAEQAEKALLRHKHALAQLKIEEDHKRLMDELGELERMDRQRRQDAVARIPVRIFQPPHKRIEDAEERQRDLEQAFEDMYMLQTGYTGDLTIALEPSTDPTLIPEEHQLLVSSEGTPRQLEETIPTVPPQKPDQERTKDVREEYHENAHTREDEEVSEEEWNEEDAQTETKAVKGEDAVKRLLLRIQRQRVQAKIERPTDAAENVEKGRKTPAAPSRMKGKHIGSRVNVLTPLPEEEEQPPDEDIPRTVPPRPQPTAIGPTTEELPKVIGDTQEMHTLLHPYEAARQARAATSREESDVSSTFQPSPSFSQEDVPLEQQILNSQLEQQRLIQQRLEEQLKDYHSKFQALSTERPTGIQMKPTAEEVKVDGNERDKPFSIRDENEYLVDKEEGSLPSIESGAISLEEQTADEEETSGTTSSSSDPWPKLIRPSENLQRLSTVNGDPHHKELSTKPLIRPSVYDSESDEDDSQKVLAPKRDLVRRLVPSLARDQVIDDHPPGHQQYPFNLKQHETTGESFPQESSSDSEGRLESEELSSSSSLDSKHQEIPTSGVPQDRISDHLFENIDRPLAFRQSQVISDSFPSLTLGSDSARNKISSETSQNVTDGSVSKTMSDQGNESSYTFPFQRRPDVKSSFQGPKLRESDSVNVTPRPLAPQATPSAAKGFDGSPNYVDEYRRKWEEEKKLIENQRHLIKQKQEQQLRRMRYYKEILERYEKGSPISPDVVHPIASGESPSLGMTSITGGIGSSSLTTVRSQLGDKFRLDSDHKPTSTDGSSRYFTNKENESMHANKGQYVPPLVGLKGSSSSSDNSYRRSFPWTSDSSSSGRIGNRLSLITKDPQVTKSTSTSDFSFPSSGTEYHSLPISPEHSAFANSGLADGSRSSITTLSELNEMMTKFTSSSENEVDKQMSRNLTKLGARTRWSEYLAEKPTSDLFHKDSPGPSTMESIPTYSAEHSSSITHPTKSETQATTGIGSQMWYLPPKASTLSVGSTGLTSEDSSPFTSNVLFQDYKKDQFGSRPRIENQWILPQKEISQAVGTFAFSSDVSSLETSSFQRQTTGLDERQPSTSISSVDSLTTSITTPIQQWVIPTKASTQSVGSPGIVGEDPGPSTRSDSNTQGSSTSTNLTYQPWVVPPKASTQSLGSLEPVGEYPSTSTQDTGGGIQSLSTNIISPFQQWVVPPKASTQSVGSLEPVGEYPSTSTQDTSGIIQSLSTNIISPFQQWVIPPKASTQSVGSLETVGEYPSTSTRLRGTSGSIQSLSTNISSPFQQWVVSPKASTRSVGSLGNVSEDQRPNIQGFSTLSTSTNSSTQECVVPPKASTQSMGSLGNVCEDQRPNIQGFSTLSTSTNSSTQEWVVPPKASTQSMGSFGTVSEESSPSTSASRYVLGGANQSPVKWYLPTKASTQSLALAMQESMHGESSPDQSVFLREPVPGDARIQDWHIPQRMTTASLSSAPVFEGHILETIGSTRDSLVGSTAFTQSLLHDNDSSTTSSENIETKLASLDAFLKQAPSPTQSLSSGSLETDNIATNQSEHSTAESNIDLKKGNDPRESPNSASTDNQEETLKDSEIGSNRSSDHPDQSQPEEPISGSTDANTVSLQDAFAQRKHDFVKNSLARVARAKEKRLEVKPRVHVKNRVKKVQPKKTSQTAKQPPKKKLQRSNEKQGK